MRKIIFLFLVFVAPYLLASDDLMLAKIYHEDIEVQDYLVSEKLDGVRARWDGKNLISRGGKVFTAPAWFIANFPKVTLDGELWSQRRDFEKISSVVRSKNKQEEWKNLKFWIFDLPLEAAPFSERVVKMQNFVKKAASPYLKMIPQNSYSDNFALMRDFEKVIAGGGEGLMLHKKDAFYKKGRSNDLLKLKQYLDAEATVLAYKEGKGKFQGMVGSLKVVSDSGVVFFIGSGLTNELRKNPPPIGSKVTFRYQSFTKNGVPRFPVFLRIRKAE
jgi:DNA ligase-1